jgi:hypothetical protein
MPHCGDNLTELHNQAIVSHLSSLALFPRSSFSTFTHVLRVNREVCSREMDDPFGCESSARL